MNKVLPKTQIKQTKETKSYGKNNLNKINLISLIRLDTLYLYVDISKRILFIEILNSNYSNDDIIIVLEYFKNFWLLAKENNIKYYMILNINNIGIYPFEFYRKIVTFLNNEINLFSNQLIACCIQSKKQEPINIIQPFLNMYYFVRPYSICKSYDEALNFFMNI